MLPGAGREEEPAESGTLVAPSAWPRERSSGTRGPGAAGAWGGCGTPASPRSAVRPRAGRRQRWQPQPEAGKRARCISAKRAEWGLRIRAAADWCLEWQSHRGSAPASAEAHRRSGGTCCGSPRTRASGSPPALQAMGGRRRVESLRTYSAEKHGSSDWSQPHIDTPTKYHNDEICVCTDRRAAPRERVAPVPAPPSCQRSCRTPILGGRHDLRWNVRSRCELAHACGAATRSALFCRKREPPFPFA